MQSVANTNRQLRQLLLQILRSGARIWDESEERELSEEECSILLKFVMLQESLELSQNKQKHREGIDKAKREGKYTGRKKIAVDQNLLRQITEDFKSKK